MNIVDLVNMDVGYGTVFNRKNYSHGLIEPKFDKIFRKII